MDKELNQTERNTHMYIQIKNDRSKIIAYFDLENVITNKDFKGCWCSDIDGDEYGNTYYTITLAVDSSTLDNFSTEELLREISSRCSK